MKKTPVGRRPKWRTAAILLALTCWACGGSDGAAPDDLRKEVAELRKELAALKTTSAKSDVDSLTIEMLLGIERFYKTHAVLDCSGGGFVPVEESGKRIEGEGYFLLACDNAAPYLNGHRLTLRIGNPQAIAYDGINLTVFWGKALPEEGLWEVGWRKKELPNMSKRSFDLPNRVGAGSWTTVQVVLAPSKPEDLAVLAIAVDTNSVRLAG